MKHYETITLDISDDVADVLHLPLWGGTPCGAPVQVSPTLPTTVQTTLHEMFCQ